MKLECPMGHCYANVKTAKDLEDILNCLYCKDILAENLEEIEEMIDGKRESIGFEEKRPKPN